MVLLGSSYQRLILVNGRIGAVFAYVWRVRWGVQPRVILPR